jgi:PAS domain-containing protein
MKLKIGQDRARRPGVATPTTLKTPRVETGHKYDADLKDSESRYRRLFESARHEILILDTGTGTIEDVNPYVLGMLGYSRSRFVGKRFWEVAAFKNVQADQASYHAKAEGRNRVVALKEDRI